ncbi:MAG TPA: hypothetical protein PLX26_13925, partial [Candidatus Competibacteraceae bacterium]|nr:hypothetical protein [Candidatus Competibacteraceae bacterium]
MNREYLLIKSTILTNRSYKPLLMYALIFVFGLLGADLACAVTTNITIHPNTVIAQINSHLLGTNAPTWITDEYENATLINRTKHSGVGLTRIPGGSVSDQYGWLSCELRADQLHAYPCVDNWGSWASRPTDFINFLRTTRNEAMFTVNVNVTKQEAAAAVAFFNAKPDNQTLIGVDRNGFDWKTAGYWAQLRTNHGNPEPFRIQYWEIGNEVYGASQCGGWENAWTCDGTQYINGDAQHDGYKQMREAMRAIDSTIFVGAVGYEDPSAFSNWGIKVIQAAGSDIDFYIIHPYAYVNLPTSTDWVDMLKQPRNHLSEVKKKLQDAFNMYAGRQIPIVATEYNLGSGQDSGKLMTRMGNALFISETIGQMISNGYWGANQWYLANATDSETGDRDSYGLIQTDNGFNRTPQYYAFPLWARFGDTMLAVDVGGGNDPKTQLSVYAGKVDADTYSVLAINKTSNPLTASITFDDGTIIIVGGTADLLQSDNQTLNSQNPIFNGVSNPSDDLSNAQPSILSSAYFNSYQFQPYSVTLLRVNVKANILTNKKTIGLYNPDTSIFYLRNSNTNGIADLTFSYGPPGAGWLPLVGDWGHNGIATIGLYNSDTSIFYLRNSNTNGVADLTFSYGPPGAGWLPLVGDWNGD